MVVFIEQLDRSAALGPDVAVHAPFQRALVNPHRCAMIQAVDALRAEELMGCGRLGTTDLVGRRRQANRCRRRRTLADRHRQGVGAYPRLNGRLIPRTHGDVPAGGHSAVEQGREVVTEDAVEGQSATTGNREGVANTGRQPNGCCRDRGIDARGLVGGHGDVTADRDHPTARIDRRFELRIHRVARPAHAHRNTAGVGFARADGNTRGCGDRTNCCQIGGGHR